LERARSPATKTLNASATRLEVDEEELELQDYEVPIEDSNPNEKEELEPERLMYENQMDAILEEQEEEKKDTPMDHDV